MRRSPGMAVPVLLVAFLAVAASAPARAGLPTETVMQESFDVGAGGALRVDVPDGDLVLRPGDSGRIEIEVRLGSRDLDRARERFDAMHFRAEAAGGEVTLRADEVRRGWLDWGDLRGFRILVEIRIPEQLDLDLRTGDGDIAIESIAGTVRIKTGDGDIAIERAEGPELRIATGDGDIAIRELVSNRVDVRTSDGDVQLERIDADDILVRTGDGDVELEGVSGAFAVSTGDGDIRVAIENLTEATLESGDGDILIEIPAGLPASLELRGSEVVLPRGVDFDGRRSEGIANGRLNGGGPTLQARTSDGTVVLRTRGG